MKNTIVTFLSFLTFKKKMAQIFLFLLISINLFCGKIIASNTENFKTDQNGNEFSYKQWLTNMFQNNTDVIFNFVIFFVIGFFVAISARNRRNDEVFNGIQVI